MIITAGQQHNLIKTNVLRANKMYASTTRTENKQTGYDKFCLPGARHPHWLRVINEANT